jgi:hypothetical protein
MDRALIKIKILDCNDNAPEFTKQNYSTSVYEDSKAGTYLLRVEAVDKDIGDNAVIRYSFSNPNIPFTIDPVSGIVRVSAKSDRETQDFYDISLVATDSGLPALSSGTSLQILILDVNDNAPNFGLQILQPRMLIWARMLILFIKCLMDLIILILNLLVDTTP